MRPKTGLGKSLVFCAMVAFAGTSMVSGSGCSDDGGYNGPAVPLMVSAVVTLQPEGTAFIMVTLSDSAMPINLVTDASVRVNGIPIPVEGSGYMYIGPAMTIVAGEDVTLTIRRGLTITATLTMPGKAEFISPAAGSVHDPAQLIPVEVTPPAVLPQEYNCWISDDFTESIMGWNDQIVPPDTTAEIRGGELLAEQSGITITCQSENRTETFDGDVLQYSYFTVSNHSESPAFSTQ